MKGEQDKAEVARREEQRKRDAEHQAVMDADEQAYLEEEAAKAAERKARGINAAGEAVRGKWDAAPKIEGAENEIILANGEKVAGRYVLVESGAATPSHNAANGFSKSDGFPFDENGQSVNDRDYERDQNAQDVTRQMAAQYDGRAVQDVPVVSREGVVLSGNGRTMAGELAARNGTDAAYVEHLKKHPQQFGFTPEQVEGMEHPRVVFVPDADMPYTAETFAKFNAQSMKSQSKTEQAVKLGKTVDDGTFNRIIRSMNAYDTIGDFYNDATAAGNAIAELQKAGVINQMQYAEMFDGEKVSEAGRQMLENMLIGKAFESNPDAVRQLTEVPSLRQSVISALAEISNNVGLDGEYSLEQEIADAIDLAYRARKAGTKAGDPVSEFARQGELFGDETVADYKNATVMMLADTLNDNRQSQLKKVLALYNRAAENSASGQMELFGGGVKNKEDIINDVLEILNYDTERLQSELDAARAQRKAAAGQGGGSESVQQDGTAGAGNSGSEDTGRSERSEAPVENEAVEAAVGGEESATTDEESRKSFATVFTQFKGKAKEAIDYILGRKTGRAIAALHHKDVGDIDLWYGNDKAGLKKIAQKHPEVLGDLQGIIDGMRVVKSSDNRIILESDTHIAVVSKMLGSEKTDNWLLSAYEKKEASGGSSDIVPEPERGKQNGTAPLQSTPSGGKGTEKGGNAQEIIENFDIDSTAYEEVENEVALLPVSIRERIDDAVRKLQKERRKQALEDEASRFTFKKIQEAGGTLSNYTKEELDKNYLSTGDAYPLHWLEFRIEPSKKKGRYNLIVSRKYDKDLPVSALSYNPFKYTTDEDLTPKEIDAKTKEWVMSNGAIGNKVSLAEYKQIVERETKATVKDGEATEPSAEPAPVETTGPQPIGKGVFGNIYDQFKGKVKEAFEFLIKHKSGDLLGVFHRDGFGDIDLVWGDKGGGAEHIIDKHVGEGKSFATEEEAFTEIDRIIKTGKKDFENGDKVVFKDGKKIVTVRKNWREKGKKIADKNWVLTAYDETSADSESPVATNKSLAGSATSVSAGKGSEVSSNTQGKNEENGNSTDSGPAVGEVREQKVGEGSFVPTENEGVFVEAMAEHLNAMGVETYADAETGRRMLDKVNGRATFERDSARRRERESVNRDIDEATALVSGRDVKDVRRERMEREERRRETAQKIYENVLQGNFDDVTLQAINDYINDVTPLNPYGRRLSERLPQRVERKMYARTRENAVDALFSRICEGAVRPHERTRAEGRRAIEEKKKELLEQWAKATGHWHTDLSEFTDSKETIGGGTDSDVYLSKDGKHVIKLSKGKPQSKRFRPDIDNIPLFNYLFPNSAYRILGYGDFGNGFVRILEQPFVDFAKSTPLTVEERVEYMKGLGFHAINKDKTAFSNGKIIVADLQKSNIVRDAAGNVSVIDADCKLHTKDVGGEYEYLPVEHDLPQRKGKPSLQKVAPVFYSNARKAVEGLKQEKATPAQWLAMLQKQGGLKAAEDKWLGLSEWLESSDAKTLTKQEVLDFIRENEVQLEEVEYAEKPKGFEELKAEYDGWLRNGGYDYAWEQLRERFGDDADIAFSDLGGELVIDNGEAAEALLGSERAINETRLGYTTEGLENKREVAITVPSVEPYNENDEIHFGDADGGRAVVWVRFGETRDSDGKRVLVIDEIQSKRHQDGREKGYKLSFPEEKKAALDEALRKSRVYNISMQEKYDSYTFPNQWHEKAIQEEIAEGERLFENYMALLKEYDSLNGIKGVPDAPFEKNWHELAMKRMLRLAAEEGFDKVAWTTGAQQAERYNIGDVVEKIVSYNYPAAKDAEGRESRKVEIRLTSGDVMTMRVNAEGRVIEGRGDTEGKELSDVVGKDLARRIMEGDGRDGSIFDADRDIPAKVIEGDGLLIGGEGMKGFYDQMLPRFMDKYGKKWGVKTGDVVLPELEGLAQRMHAVDVTPEMKASVMEGQPMFFRTADGEAYGFTVDGRIYIDPRIATRETPLHEYDHLWSEALEKANPEAWAHLKAKLREKEDLLAYVKGLYPEIEDENELLHEVFSHFAGRRGAERLKEMEHAEVAKTKGVLNKARVVDMFRRLRDLLREYWTMARNLFAGDNAKLKGMSAEDFADMAMSDFVRGFNPVREMSEREANPHKDAQLRLVVGRNAMEDDYHVGIRSIDDIKTYEEAVREGEGLDSYPDFTREDAERALQKGEITVYSSKPIEQGGFVSTSRMEAKEYAGGGRVYEKRVSLDDVAWIYASEGQYAKVDEAAANEGSADGTNSTDVAERDAEYARLADIVEKPARIEKLRRSVPVEITKEDYEGKYELNADDAQQWIKDNLRGEQTIADTGEVILISKVGAEEVTSHSRYDTAHLKSIVAIPKMLHDAVFLGEQKNTKGNGKFDSYRYYAVGLKIDGEDYTAKIVVGVKQGKKYYDHRLTQMEKTKLIDLVNQSASGFTTAGNASLPPYAAGKDTKLVSLLQTNPQEIANAEARMREILDEVKREKGYTADSDYQGSLAFNGAAPSRNAYFDTKEERAEAFRSGDFEGDYSLGDFMDSGLDNNDLGWQLDNPIPASGRDKATLESIRNIASAVKGGKRTIKMYRAVDADVKEGSFRNGDWVTPSREYAERHIGLQDWEKGRIIEQEVPVDDIWWNGDDINEWGYDDGKGYAYKNTENNRKSDELITRDDNGRLILPSERFNEGNPDISFHKAVGGNRGYVGYSMSRRAAEARSEGRYPKTDFKKEYGLSEKAFKGLEQAGIIGSSEWHHTSKYGNKTAFYSWEEPWMADAYAERKKDVDAALKEYATALSEYEAMSSTFWYDYVELRSSDREAAEALSEKKDVLKEAVREKKFAVEKIFDDWHAGREGEGVEVSSEPAAVYESKDGSKVEFRSLLEDSEKADGEVSADSSNTDAADGLENVRLRKLEPGEACNVERVYEETKQFSFTGKEKIESQDDVAYIFKQLENAAVENSFLVLVKDGHPTVVHLGMGSYTQTMADGGVALAAYKALKPEKVYFVHNHPSGALTASMQDFGSLQAMEKLFGAGVVQPGIIIDTTSGKYGVYGVDEWEKFNREGSMPSAAEGSVPVKTYTFSRQVFAPDWNPEGAIKVSTPNSIAAFVSSHRLGERGKMSLLVLDQAGHITANYFLPWSRLTEKMSKSEVDAMALEIAGYVHQSGGVRCVLYGNYDYAPGEQDTLRVLSAALRDKKAPLLDVVHIDRSAYEEGRLAEPEESYGVDARDAAQRMDERNGTEVVRFIDFLRRGRLEQDESRYFHVGETGDILNEHGISGKITIGTSAVNSHHNKDADHLDENDWVKVIEKINEPVAITEYGDKGNSYRIYTIVEKNGKNICVGVDVNSVGRDVNITNIRTAFARDIANALNERLVYPHSRTELETAIRELSLRQNREVYPEQPFDAANVGNNSDIDRENEENVSGEPEEGYGLNGDASADAAELAAYDAGRMSLAERAAQAVAAMSAKNRADVEARREAVKALGGNLQKLRQAMARQREYDKGTVDAIVRQARIMLEGGMLDGMTRGEVKKLLSLVNKAAGREDITRQADGVVELMAKHLVRQGKATMESLLKTRDKKVNAKGVEAQGRLDVAGQRMIDAFREALPLDEESLVSRIADCEDRMGSEDSVTARNAEAEHEGLMLAKRHLEEIKASEAEEAELRHELKQAEEKVHGGDYSSFGSKEAYREYVRETEAAIRENLLERVEAYGRLNQQFGGNLVGSAARAKAFREAEKQRVREIQHNANSDLEGMPANEHGKIKKTFRDWGLVRFFMRPLATFDTMLRYFGGKSVDGRGYLFNRFMPQWQKAFDGEFKSLRDAHKELDAKVSEVMGTEMLWSDLFTQERLIDAEKGGGTEVEFMDGGEKVRMKLTQGNMLYIYMVNKMADGRMKLRNMGITEEAVEAIKAQISPKYIEIADWIQDEFLVKKREEYNAVHERVFGASMAAIEDYFPLKINSRSRGKSEDVGSMESDEIMPGTIAGSIKKRTRNGLALDITGADAFDVVLEHLQEMEHWAHFAELNRDLNTLLSYKKFKNRVLGMKSLRYGGGEKIWKNFRDTCRIVAGTYRQSVTPDSTDKFVTNVAKGVTGAKISFRIFTALKQLLSYPAYLSNASIVELAKSSNPVGMVKSWNWAIENLPGFAQRWQSRQAGDTRLMDTASDWSIWHSEVVEKATRWGMTPNAFVDGMTVAMGAKAIYETKLKGYKKAGYSDAAAQKKALEDASIAYNETQQSSASAYTSAMQLDRTVASTMLTVFRNASMGYQRKYFGALANLKRKMRKGYKDESIAFMAKQVQREWNDSANEQFNEDLQKQIDGTLPDGHVYNLGLPGNVLLGTGFPNVPIEMSASHLAEKANTAHHPFDIDEMKDLVRALQKPVAVFGYGDAGKAQNVIVEIEHDGKHFVVGIHFNQQRGNAEVSSIRGLYPKDNAEWLNWISQGKMLYADKEKIQAILSQQRRTLADVAYLDLDDVAKKVKDFGNPKTDEDFVSQEAKDYAKRLYNKSYYKDLADTVIFGWVLQFAWNLGPYLPYLLMGDDDDEKDAMLEDAAMHALAGGVEGLSGGNVMSDLYNLKRSGEKIGTYNFNLLPLMSDLQTTLKHFDNDAVSGMTDLVNLAVQSGFGFNPQTATDGMTRGEVKKLLSLVA